MTNHPPLFLGVDLGTSACKVLAMDGEGQVVAKHTATYPMLTLQPGWAEQDPADWWQATNQAVRRVLAALPAGSRVQGIGLSGQMHGLTALDAGDRVIRPSILWCDQRAARCCDELTGHMGGLAGLLELTQNRMLPGFTAGKVLWMAEHEPERHAVIRRILNPKDYLRLLLTGRHATDVSEASGTGLFNVRERRWSEPMIEAVGLPLDALPEVHESHAQTGGLLEEVATAWGLPAGLPVYAGGGDSVIQTASMGVIGPGSIGVTLGTAGIVAAGLEACPPNPDGRLQVSCGNGPGLWHVMGVSLNVGGVFEWLREAVAGLVPGLGRLEYEGLVALARQAPPGAGGLMFLPYLQGERCPHVAPEGRGGWIGLTRLHRAEHLVRSAMEGIICNLRSIVNLLVSAGASPTRLKVSGGATNERFWLELLADSLQRNVITVTGAAEGGAYAAAMIAGVGAGHWPTLGDALTIIREVAVVEPNPAHRRVYDQLTGRMEKIYPALQPIFTQLAEDEGASR